MLILINIFNYYDVIKKKYYTAYSVMTKSIGELRETTENGYQS